MPEITFIDETWTVDSSAEDVYEFMTSVDRWSEWASKINTSSKSGGSEWQPGDVLEFEPDLLLSFPIQAKVFEVNPDRRISWGAKFPGFRLEHGFEFRDVDGSCEVHQFERAEGILSLGAFPLKPLLYDFDHQWGNDLQEAFE